MGKGSSWRKGTNFKAYQEAEYWKELEIRKSANKITEEVIKNIKDTEEKY